MTPVLQAKHARGIQPADRRAGLDGCASFFGFFRAALWLLLADLRCASLFNACVFPFVCSFIFSSELMGVVLHTWQDRGSHFGGSAEYMSGFVPVSAGVGASVVGGACACARACAVGRTCLNAWASSSNDPVGRSSFSSSNDPVCKRGGSVCLPSFSLSLSLVAALAGSMHSAFLCPSLPQLQQVVAIEHSLNTCPVC